MKSQIKIIINSLKLDNFPDRAKLRGGVYFVESIPKTPIGKIQRTKAIEQAVKLFREAKENDIDVQSYLSEISHEFRTLIQISVLTCNIKK